MKHAGRAVEGRVVGAGDGEVGLEELQGAGAVLDGVHRAEVCDLGVVGGVADARADGVPLGHELEADVRADVTGLRGGVALLSVSGRLKGRARGPLPNADRGWHVCGAAVRHQRGRNSRIR